MCDDFPSGPVTIGLVQADGTGFSQIAQRVAALKSLAAAVAEPDAFHQYWCIIDAGPGAGWLVSVPDEPAPPPAWVPALKRSLGCTASGSALGNTTETIKALATPPPRRPRPAALRRPTSKSVTVVGVRQVTVPRPYDRSNHQ
jgi:hypothetical protein